MECEFYLEKVLNHRLFKRSRRQKELLCYLFDNTMIENKRDIKELTLAIDIYGELPCFNPDNNGYVRVAIHKLRMKLEEYYNSDGQNDGIKFYIPRGKYCLKYYL